MKDKAKKRDVFRFVLMIIMSTILGFSIYSCNAHGIVGNNLPMPFGFGVGVVMSGSMEPDLNVNDVIFVKECDEYEVGEWVVFQDKNILIVHEIIAIDGEDVLTKGTANDSEDEPIKKSDIKGKVVFHIGKIGVIVNVLKSPIGTMLIMLLAGFLFIKSYSGDKENTDQEDIEKIKQEIEKLKGNPPDDTEKTD